MSLAPYHVVRFHVAYRETVRERKTGNVTVYDEPIGAPRPRAQAIPSRQGPRWTARVYDPEDADPWKRGVIATVRSILPITPYDYPARVDIDWFFRPPQSLEKLTKLGMIPVCVRPDRDNLDKSTLDALVEGRLLYDDSSVAIGTVAKWYVCGSRELAGTPSLLPWEMATREPGISCDYRTEPGAIIRVSLWKWEQLGLKRPTRSRRPEAVE